MNSAEGSDDRQKLRRSALLLSALAIVGMGSVTVACSPRHEKPAETSVPAPSTEPSGTPTEKNVRTNVTRTPMSAVPPGGGGNPAIPCGFGPAGGLPCSNNSN